MTEETKFKTAEQILAINDLREDVAYVPDWDTHVRLRTLTKARQQACRKAATIVGTDAKQSLDVDKFEMAMLQQAIIEPVFTDAQFEQLLGKSEANVRLLLDAYSKLAGLTVEEAKQTKKDFS